MTSGDRRRFVLLTAGVLVAALFVLDQGTKHWAEANLVELRPEPVVGEILHFTLLYNSGAAWGLGSGITPVVTLLQIIIASAVIVLLVRSVRTWSWTVAFALIVGGALGNIYDRLLRPPGPFRGEVVDFLQLPNWPVFNVADMAVVAGAVLVVLLGLIGTPMDPADAGGDTEDSADIAHPKPRGTGAEGDR
ncbi:MAG: signal peptidase II [Brachybacterium sp.]|nr:signal peptidase II [Brachybacterium sp.]